MFASRYTSAEQVRWEPAERRAQTAAAQRARQARDGARAIRCTARRRGWRLVQRLALLLAGTGS